MSRLEAKAKLLYYRTPEPIVEALAQYLLPPRRPWARLLDPCAGTGAALSLLAQRLTTAFHQHQPHAPIQLDTYGIEPELVRVKAAASVLTQVLYASFFSTILSNGSSADGGWQLLFLNPPYDTDTEMQQRGRKSRLEVNFLKRATEKLCAEGVLIWIVPQSSLKPAAKFLACHYDQLSCVRFPDDLWQPDDAQPEQVSLYSQFKQVVLCARKRCYELPPPEETVALIEHWATLGSALEALPLQGSTPTIPPYQIPSARERTLRHFAGGAYDPDGTAGLVLQRLPKTAHFKTGVWAQADYLSARIPDPKTVGFGIGTPMGPLKKAHLAVLSVAGIANRAVLESQDGRRVLVKGYARKVSVYSQHENEDEIVERVTDTFETALWCVDLATGGLLRIETGRVQPVIFPVQYESLSLKTFLDSFGASLTQQVAQANPPRYTGEEALPWVREAFRLIRRAPLGKQREVILEHVHGFLTPAGLPGEAHVLNRVAPVAEMATGKTFLSLCSAFLADRYACGGVQTALPGTKLLHLFPLVVLCPPIMARKWRREAEATLPDVRAIIVKRMGTPSTKGIMPPEEEDDEDDEMTIDDLTAFRRFDPDFHGTALSALGCLDRTVARIQIELEAWRRDVAFVEAHNRAIGRGLSQDEPLPVPRKPCHLIILTTSTAKLGQEWRPIYRLKVARMLDPRTRKVVLRRTAEGKAFTIPCCPTCFRALKDEREVERLSKTSPEFQAILAQLEKMRTRRRLEAYEEEALEPLSLYLTEKELQGTKEHRVKRWCSECGAALWQVVSNAVDPWEPISVLSMHPAGRQALPLPSLDHLPAVVTSTFRRRYPLSDYLLKRYKHVFHLLIADEVHQGADGTALDFARQRLACACGRMMGLTGTLSNGYAGSLFRLYYVLNPAVRHAFGYHEVERWIDLYGKRQETTKTYKEKEQGHGASSDRRVGKPNIKEIAGFAPQGLAHILPCSTFLELVDVVPPIPYREEVREVSLGPILGPAYEAFERETTREIGTMLACGDTSGLSSWWNGLRTYPNMPYRGWTTIIKKTQTILGNAPALPEDQLYPKERAIVDYVQQEYDARRRVLIYTENTGYYDNLPRLKKMLESKIQGRAQQPITVTILRSTTVETIDRERWLDKQVQAGCDVLICNPKLVEIGLDLIAFPTIIFASIPTSTSGLRQASRRPVRPGQTQPVRVVFFVYPTVEFRLLRKMGTKMKASLMVEGKLPSEGLVSFGEEEEENEHDLYVQLAREVLASLDTERPEDLLKEAQDLQDLFLANAQAESEKNQPLGNVDEAEPLVFDPIRQEPLSTSSAFEGDALVIEGSLVTPVPSREAVEIDTPTEPHVQSMPDAVPTRQPGRQPRASNKRVAVKNARAHADNPPAEEETVTIIHTSITSGQDPWAALRATHPPKARRRKKVVVVQDQPTLWTGVEFASITQVPSTPQPQWSQPSLWE